MATEIPFLSPIAVVREVQTITEEILIALDFVGAASIGVETGRSTLLG
jgi:hypothetical protein